MKNVKPLYAKGIKKRPRVMDSQVSVVVERQGNDQSGVEQKPVIKRRPLARPSTPANELDRIFSPDREMTTTVGGGRTTPIPIRPPASSPPTPEPLSAISVTRSFMTDLGGSSPKQSFDTGILFESTHPFMSTSRSLPMLNAEATGEQPSEPAAAGQEEDHGPRQHLPRRFPSQPLLNRKESMAGPANPRSVSHSPGLPARSPLRLARGATNTRDREPSQSTVKASTKRAPSIESNFSSRMQPALLRATVVTECTGPIKRPKSPVRSGSASSPCRKERMRAPKLLDRPAAASRAIDAVVNDDNPSAPRQRLRKVRPHIQVPDGKRANPLTTRTSSSASSDASWKKVTEFTRVPVPHVSSEDGRSNGEKAVNSPVSPVSSRDSRNDAMTLSPVMLVAEEIPLSKPRSSNSKASGKYAPRPRSASVPRSQRQSRPGTRTPSRPSTPTEGSHRKQHTPPMPLPPPMKALPPTPAVPTMNNAARQSEMAGLSTRRQQHPLVPLYSKAPEIASSRYAERAQHVVSQTQRTPLTSTFPSPSGDLDTRVDALERKNALLLAALNAMVMTNGRLNSSTVADVMPRRPMVWQDRIARRNAASKGGHGGEAFDMYLNSRQNSRHR